jgi:hypothetical protein
LALIGDQLAFAGSKSVKSAAIAALLNGNISSVNQAAAQGGAQNELSAENILFRMKVEETQNGQNQT